MTEKLKELLKFIFPEYQIIANISERGFIAKIPSKSGGQSAAGGSGFTIQAYTPPENDAKFTAKANKAFKGLADSLKKSWIGSERDRKFICKAFQRPYVRGFDSLKPRNTILLIGTESRGRTYSVRCISELLKQRKVFRYEEVATLDCSEYSADSSDILFLSDVYRGLNTNTESIVFENIDKASLSQLDIVYRLISEGTYRLKKSNNESLTEATGALNTNLIPVISGNGKYFVFTTSLSQAQIISHLGNKIINEISDIIILDPIERDQIIDLVTALTDDMITKCKTNLHINVKPDKKFLSKIVSHYTADKGVKYLIDYIDDQIYESLSEMKLEGVIKDREKIKITYDDEYYIIPKRGDKLSLSGYVKNYNGTELEEARKELNQVIGLSKVKEYVLNLENNFKVQKLRESKGLKQPNISMHMIFTGNPGTGKTTIARIVAKYLKAIGILSSGHLCEVTRADFVGEYVGSTAIKTTRVINSALGGVLFIDEAYSLVRDKTDSFGLEAIDALVKGIEDHREDLVVILAGYEDEMQQFLKSNPGLKSRFPNVVHFDDYSVDEMYEIANVTAAAKGYKIAETCKEGLLHFFEKRQIKGRNDSGNGRLVRNIIENAILKQSQRMVENPEDNLELLIPEDFSFDKIVKFDLEKSLSEIIGLDRVKEFLRTQYTVLQADKKRKKANISVNTGQALNMIFSGNPGTGKTTMARIVAEMLHSMDILKSGQLIETDRSGLVAEYVGQTAQKTKEVFKSALGGVLFIDEAYSILNDGSGFGRECIDTLVKLIEDYRGEVVVILAGYTKEMAEFLKSNPGLESRFPLRIEFPDYSVSELTQIGKQMITKRGFTLQKKAEAGFTEAITKLKQNGGVSSGNGRMVRNFIEQIIRRQSARIAVKKVAKKDLAVILPIDINSDTSTNAKFDLEKDLSNVIGLEAVKSYIRSLNARLKVQAERKKVGLKTDPTQTLHMIFAGNPGTGKTMMARMVANVLYNMNIIPTNKLIETDRSGLVAGYVGQTAIKTRQVIETALGGVLFIDEAYALAQGGENDFGQEAIDTLVKMMDDNRDKLVVILAGYSDSMKNFLKKNAGLQSRFANIIEFPDYTIDELMQIAEGMYSEQGYTLSEAGKKVLYSKIEMAKNNKQFGNGRYVRNVFERSLNNQALRLSKSGDYSKEAMSVITDEDIRGA